MTPASMRKLRKIVAAAKRGKEIQIVPTLKPPCILMLGFEDYAHAVAVAKFIRAFDSVGVAALLDELDSKKVRP